MMENNFEFQYEVYNNIKELSKEDASLLLQAQKITAQSYAPYSHFHVGAVAKLANGKIVVGTNQENASYPVGICAERVLLGSAANLYPDIAIESIAISYDSKNPNIKKDHPIFPCGMCRQSLVEYEIRFNKPIRLILGGQDGKVFIIKSAGLLLPFAFTAGELS